MPNYLHFKYGLKLHPDNASIELLNYDEDPFDQRFNHIAKIYCVHQHNANGLSNIEIYTNRELKEISVGNWKVNPKIEMPFFWSGYSIKIEVTNLNGEIGYISYQPSNDSVFQHSGFEAEVKYVCDSINELMMIEDVEHLKLMRKIKDTLKKVKEEVSSQFSKDGSSIFLAAKLCNTVKEINDEYDVIKQRLKIEYVDHMKKEINELLSHYNKIFVRPVR